MARIINNKFYLTVEPKFTLTNTKTKETIEFGCFEDLIKATLKKSCLIYVYEQNKLAKALMEYFLNNDYNYIPSANMDNAFVDKLEPKQLTSIGSLKDNETLYIRCRKNKNIQTIYQNFKALVSGASIEEIAKFGDGNDDEITGAINFINYLEDLGHTECSIASNSFADYKKTQFGKIINGKLEFAKTNFNELFPKQSKEEHDFVMKAFTGGLCLYNEKYKGVNIVKGKSYDVNSMYTSVMAEELIPRGEGHYYIGACPNNHLHIQRLKIKHLKIKKNCYPCIRNSKEKNYFKEASDVELILSSIDVKLLLEKYDIEGLEFIDGYWYYSRKGMFDKFINKWMTIKQNAPEDSLERFHAKITLNSCFGKFASRTDRLPSTWKKLSDGTIKRRNLLTGKKKFEGSSVYAPVAIFITAYARQRLLEAIEAQGDNFIYSDTDSIYVKEEAKGIEVHPTNLGKWKEEFTFNKIVIIGKKQYCVQKSNNKLKVVLAGIPDEVTSKIDNFNDIYIGKEFEYKIKMYDNNANPYLVDHNYLLKDENIE